MSTFAWMRFLESSPERYDRGIRMLSRGRIDDVYQRIASAVAAPGRRVLDIGCGTGGVTLACAARGAHVVGVDIDAGMLEVARKKSVPTNGDVEWMELGVAEITDHFEPATFDAVVSCLVFSELSAQEQTYALKVALSVLVPGGEVVIADEILPRGALRRGLHRLRRAPRHALTYLLTQTTTRPVRGLARSMTAAGFVEVEEESLWSDTFVVARAVKPRMAA
jgi:demethylmenaquinone methyltransferase/2-methoxy-6-polyprenyl-1,4-benzoquinol methylase